ncbi:FtsX-like permease family protein [Actinomadura sp. HBU206391]|uniref:FtsX-like permease family protein n=1 Tax=Actinomadura sp. HBU206391 TaxID=2731692 RepID=UPI001650BB3C|nr:ABC transporter permease [Actinomadura sp. HBU206391]MBC6459955.1 FtsX-like permease family protein [Actinomadura sp. HBU206391]
MSRISSSRAALRIARRDALRAKGRTALVVCMIALPVMVITALAVLIRTDNWSAAESLPSELGRADARIEGYDRTPVLQDPNGIGSIQVGEGVPGRPWKTADVGQVVAAKFGPGARVIPMASGGEASIKTDRGYVTATVRELDLRDPVTRGILRVTAGRPPASQDEITISTAVRERGFRLGGSIQVDRAGERKTVVGYLEDPRAPRSMIVHGLPGALLGEDPQYQWLVTGGRPVSWADVRDLNKSGLLVLSREVVRRPPAKSEIPSEVEQGGPQAAEIAIIAMIISMIVLEVVLLAGPAFAVGIGRQRRQLALVAAGGGSRRHLRIIVLGGGLVLGFGAGVLGLLAGLGVAAVAVPVIEHFGTTTMGPYEIPWRLAAVTLLVGVLSGLAAAYVPARQASRMNVVAALAGRREQARTRKGWPIAGALLIVAGTAASVLGVRELREFGAAIGAIAIIAGFVMAGPWIIGLTGRLARWLPLPMRLAVRDASRNRGRTGPVVAAIMAAVAGMTALAVASTSDFAQQRVEYVPRLQAGSTVIQGVDAGDFQRVRQAAARELPGVPVTELSEVGAMSACAAAAICTGVELATLGDCSDDNPQACLYGSSEFGWEYVVGDEAAARFIIGRDDPAVTAALRAGKAVLFEPRGVRDGVAIFKVVRSGQGGFEDLRKVTIPAVRADAAAAAAPTALLPPVAARRLGLPITPTALLIASADHRVTAGESRRLDEAMAEGTDRADIYTERGFVESFGLPLLLLAVGGAIMVLGGSLISTGLSAADARPDLATLAAVGARPRTRRLLMMGQAGFVALLGCWLGIAAGLIPGIAVAFPLTSNDGAFGDGVLDGVPKHGVIIDIPFQLLGGVGIVVPLVAMIAAGLFTRSRLPVVRRIG